MVLDAPEVENCKAYKNWVLKLREGVSNIAKVLVIQTAFIGDVVLVTPLFKALKKEREGLRIHFMGIPETANLVENNPNVEQLVIYDKRGQDKGTLSLVRMAKRLRAERYDLALIPHRSFRSALLSFLAGIPERVGFDTSAGSFLLTRRVPYRRDVHEVERNLDLLAPFGIEVSDKKPEIFPDHEDVKTIEAFFEEEGITSENLLVAIAPGSVWPTKRWPKARFAQLAQRLINEHSAEVILIGGGQDRKLCQWMAQSVGENIHNAAGRFTLRQSAEIIRRCRVLLSNDSAPMHLGVAVGTRVVALFGPTVPAFGFYPYGQGHKVVEKELNCRPCGIHGGKKCPQKHFDCMRKIAVEEVYRVVAVLLSVR